MGVGWMLSVQLCAGAKTKMKMHTAKNWNLGGGLSFRSTACQQKYAADMNTAFVEQASHFIADIPKMLRKAQPKTKTPQTN